MTKMTAMSPASGLSILYYNLMLKLTKVNLNVSELQKSLTSQLDFFTEQVRHLKSRYLS